MSVALEHVIVPSERHVINHDMSGFAGKNTSALHLSSSAALAISEPGDIIQLHPALKDEWDEISAHYRRIGLRHTHEVVWSLNPRELGSHAGYHPSVYYFGANACQFWGDYEWLAIVEWISSKNNFTLLANELGIETPHTLCYKSTFDINDCVIESIPYPCYIKAALPGPEPASVRCRDQYELRNALLNFRPADPVQLQSEVMAESYVTLQFSINGNQLTRLAATEKSSNDYQQPGHRMPSTHSPWEIVEPMAEWLKARGMKGVFAFDLAATRTRRGLRYLVIGCDPHFHETAYPTMIAEKLEIPEWRLVIFSSRHRRLATLDIADVEFEKITGEGAILVNWGTLANGQVSIMLAGSTDYQDALEVELMARL